MAIPRVDKPMKGGNGGPKIMKPIIPSKPASQSQAMKGGRNGKKKGMG